MKKYKRTYIKIDDVLDLIQCYLDEGLKKDTENHFIDLYVKLKELRDTGEC